MRNREKNLVRSGENGKEYLCTEGRGGAYVCAMETHKDRGLVECKGGVHTSMTAERETNDGFKILTSHSLHLPLPPPPLGTLCMYIHTLTHRSAFPWGRAAWWGDRVKQSRRQAIGKHHVVVNDVVESWEHGPIVNPEQAVTLQQYV